MIFDYFVLNSNADLPQRELDATKFAERVEFTDCRNVIIKYVRPLAPTLKTRDSRNGLTRFMAGDEWLSGQLGVELSLAAKALSGGRLGLYLPAPRADYAVSQIGGVDGVIERARDLIESGVTDLFFDAQAKGHTYDRLVLDCMADEGLRVHVEPFVADRHTCQECSPLHPGDGLERGILRRPSTTPASLITALITDAAPTREDTLAYAKKWLDLGVNIAFNAHGWKRRHGITAAELADIAAKPQGAP